MFQKDGKNDSQIFIIILFQEKDDKEKGYFYYSQQFVTPSLFRVFQLKERKFSQTQINSNFQTQFSIQLYKILLMSDCNTTNQEYHPLFFRIPRSVLKLQTPSTLMKLINLSSENCSKCKCKSTGKAHSNISQQKTSVQNLYIVCEAYHIVCDKCKNSEDWISCPVEQCNEALLKNWKNNGPRESFEWKKIAHMLHSIKRQEQFRLKALERENFRTQCREKNKQGHSSLLHLSQNFREFWDSHNPQNLSQQLREKDKLLAEEIEKSNKLANDIQAKAQQYQEFIEKCDKFLLKYEKQIEDLSQKLFEKENQLKDDKIMMSQFAKHIQRDPEQEINKKSQQEIYKLHEQIKKLKKEIEEATQNHQKEQEKNNLLIEKHRQTCQQYENAKIELLRLQSEMTALEHGQMRIKQNQEKLKKELEQKQSIVVRLQMENRDLETKLREKEQSYEVQLNNLQTQKQKIQNVRIKEISFLIWQNDELKKQKNRLQVMKKNHNNLLQDYVKQLQDKTNNIIKISDNQQQDKKQNNRNLHICADILFVLLVLFFNILTIVFFFLNVSSIVSDPTSHLIKSIGFWLVAVLSLFWWILIILSRSCFKILEGDPISDCECFLSFTLYPIFGGIFHRHQKISQIKLNIVFGYVLASILIDLAVFIGFILYFLPSSQENINKILSFFGYTLSLLMKIEQLSRINQERTCQKQKSAVNQLILRLKQESFVRLLRNSDHEQLQLQLSEEDSINNDVSKRFSHKLEQ